jgi:hypothetical protein
MSTIRKNPAPIKAARQQNAGKTGNTTSIDHREQLCNDGQTGPVEQVSLPLAMITTLRGIILDVDPHLFRAELVTAYVITQPVEFYRQVIGPMLDRHPVMRKAEVRVSGRGLHVILWLTDPVEFTTDADRMRWAGIVKVIQRLLPTDPDCPGITALTRPIGSVNSENHCRVRQLHKGEPVPADEVVRLFDEVHSSPFRTIARLLFGSDHLTPCPVCNGPRSKLDALDFVGKCYGGCGKVRIGQLYDVFLKARLASEVE